MLKTSKEQAAASFYRKKMKATKKKMKPVWSKTTKNTQRKSTIFAASNFISIHTCINIYLPRLCCLNIICGTVVLYFYAIVNENLPCLLHASFLIHSIRFRMHMKHFSANSFVFFFLLRSCVRFKFLARHIILHQRNNRIK